MYPNTPNKCRGVGVRLVRPAPGHAKDPPAGSATRGGGWLLERIRHLVAV